MHQADTIAAIATSMNSSGIGIIRISGSDSISIVDSIYKGKKSLLEYESHTINYGHIIDDNGDIVDEVMVVIMKAPRSFTTEDTVEIDCHGGLLVMKKILSLVIKHGARCADPGEFSKRAFLNGRIDLSQAESIMDLISSNSEIAMKNSLKQLSGALQDKINNIRDGILYETAYIESALDDPEHYDLTGYGDLLLEKLNIWILEIEKLISSFSSGQVMKEGINTLILGKPNAGKSSLLNALARRDRAIVTDIAGTTRDTLEEQIIIKGVSLNIIDTAGIRNTDDVVEKIGVDKALNKIEEANLILYVVDSSIHLDENDYAIIDKIKEKKVVILLNKSDLDNKVSETDILEHIDATIVSFSSKSLEGLDRLEDTITSMFFEGSINSNNEIYITNQRQLECLKSAYDSFNNVIESINNCMPEDFLSIDLMDSYISLGRITGQTIEDDLANKIFSEFCMGK
ncbi:MAG: tRNA uridine-5-carboxymethylaminomethyl(34) synthesis GTPase MnmE [Pseudobutyrivibrio sp.]|nr:tRNA uridine-5-carboxymethylaminomethyl(34) synthesis GTPase MnmE [Pseudobutyrivibrio sp.]